jgi:HEAT repeats
MIALIVCADSASASCRDIDRHHVCMMNVSCVLLVSLLFSILPGVEHRAPQGYRDGGFIMPAKELPPLPTGLQCELEVPSGQVMLGAGWLVHYVAHIRGPVPFSISFGGDYQAPRPIRTWLEADDPDGRLAVDPLAGSEVMCMGGMGGEPTLAPGTEHVVSINARLYVDLDRPGRWTIRVFHDLGYGPPRGDDDPRWTTATVDLVMPDAAQAKLVLAEHRSRMAENGGVAGKRQEPWPDFAAMAFPIYLPLLASEVAAGSRYAIEGIAAIPSAEAADELLRIAERVPPSPLAAELREKSSQGSVPLPHPQATALLALAARLPAMPGRKWENNPSPGMVMTMTRERIERLRRLALASTTTAEASLQSAASYALVRCISPEQREGLVSALDYAAAHGDPSTVGTLLLAWRALPQVEIPAADGDGIALIWLDQIQHDTRTRPEGWQDRLAHLLSSPRARVRELAIGCIPEQDPERWAPLLLPLLKDPDPSVRWNAVTHAGRCKHMSLLPALRQAMDDQMTNTFAAASIAAIAGREAGVNAWIDQIESGTIPYAADLGLQSAWYALTGANLFGGPKHGDLSAAQRKDLAVKLRRFVSAHREAIARGPIGPPDATWPSDLLPEDWHMQLGDNMIWPLRSSGKK